MVLMWWVTLCLTGVLGDVNFVRVGNSDRRVRWRVEESVGQREVLGEIEREQMPCTCRCVFVLHLNHESMVSRKIGTEDGILYVGNDENPR